MEISRLMDIIVDLSALMRGLPGWILFSRKGFPLKFESMYLSGLSGSLPPSHDRG